MCLQRGRIILTGKVGTILLNEFLIKDNDLIYVDMDITEMIVGLFIPAGPLTIKLGNMYIEKVHVESDVELSANNGDLKVQLVNSNISLDQGQMTLGDSEACIDLGFLGDLCIPLGGGLIGTIVDALKGPIGDLLPSILNPILEQNLNKLVIGGLLSQPENQTGFNMILNIDELGTGTVDGNYDLLIGLESVADVIDADPGVKPSLGPVFFDDPIDPSDIFNAYSGGSSNLSVAVNSNLINQSLNAIYAIGASHFTLYKGSTYYGAQKNIPVDDTSPKDADGLYTATIASKGDTRIRLWPDMPPALTFKDLPGSGGAAEAKIEYESATLSLDKLVDVDGSGPGTELEWQDQFVVNANFDLAVQINEDEGVFTMGAAGPPSFNLEVIKNNTNIQIPTVILQSVFDAALLMGGDILADRFIVLDLGAIAKGTINGTEIEYISADDFYDQDSGECIRYLSGGTVVDPDSVAAPTYQNNIADGKYDRICQTLEFEIVTDVVGVIGDKGSNLWFQMQANDPKYPAPASVPDMDLDDDGWDEGDDNCTVGFQERYAAMTAAGGVSQSDLNNDGIVDSAFLIDVRGYVNDIIYAQSQGTVVTLTGTPAVVSAAVQVLETAPAVTSPTYDADIDWYNNNMRLGDASISAPTTWLELMYANVSQQNSDGDSIGDLCEIDNDRDGIWSSGQKPGTAVNYDNCSVTYNPGQEDNYGSPSSGAGDACNIRETFILLQSKTRGQCISHENFSASYTGGSPVNPSSNTNGFRYTIFRACDQADARQRFYFKENTSPSGAPAPASSVVAQLWTSVSRDGFFLATAVAGQGSPELTADDVVVTNHVNYGDGTQSNDWIFSFSGDNDYPYKIRSYKFYTQDYPAASNWCIFDKFTFSGHPLPDQDFNSCNGGSDSGGTNLDAPLFQMLLGPGMEPWNGVFE